MGKINPESLEVANTYLATLDVSKTASTLGVEYKTISDMLSKPEVKRYIDNAFLEQGYNNRFKLSALLDTILESKIEEAEESGVYTSKDILDVIGLISKIRKDSTPAEPAVQVNTQVNYTELIRKLV